jgi:hypothetical protein
LVFPPLITLACRRETRTAAASSLVGEAQLEDMIVAVPSIIHDQRMLIGRRIDAGYGGQSKPT